MESKAPKERKLHIAALGSSFAAGPGIPPQVNRHAGRSGNNYAHILSRKLDAQLTDLTVSGATLQNIISEPQITSVHNHRFEPQIDSLPPDADIVTVTAGGNDLGYVGGIMKDTVNASLVGSLLSWFAPPPATHASVEEAVQRFIKVIDRIHKIAPKARVLLVEYFTIFGADTKSGVDVSLSEAQIKIHQSMAEKLHSVYKLAAEARPFCEIVKVGERSWEHGIGSTEPWVEGFSLKILWAGNPFHPNQKGMEAVAEMILEKVRIGEKVPLGK